MWTKERNGLIRSHIAEHVSEGIAIMKREANNVFELEDKSMQIRC